MAIKAVLFDFDNTLGDRTNSAYRSYKQIILDHSDLKDGDYLLESIVQDCLLYDEYGNGDKNMLVKRINDKYHLNMQFDDFNLYWADVCYKGYTLFDDTIETLEYLKKKYRLAVISNGIAYAQQAKMDGTGITKYMEFTMISGNYAYKKPDKELYEIALERMGLQPDEVVFVGDTFSTDILGALNAHIRPIVICPDPYHPFHKDITRIYKISDLCQLL